MVKAKSFLADWIQNRFKKVIALNGNFLFEWNFFCDRACYNFFNLETTTLLEVNKKKFQSFIS